MGEMWPEEVFKGTIAPNFPNMRKTTVTQVHEMQRVLYNINPWRNMPRHILIKLKELKTKKNNKRNKGKATNNIQGNSHKVINGFLSRNSGSQKGVARGI